MTETQTEAFEIRAVAHVRPDADLRAAQRWQHGVRDESVAAVMYAIERGTVFYRNRAGRWSAPTGTPVHSRTLGRDLSTVINEMIRTGLVRHLARRHGMVTFDYLIPALVHLRMDGQSACLFTGEDIGPMRARLVDGDHFSLIDCLLCEQVVASGHARGL